MCSRPSATSVAQQSTSPELQRECRANASASRCRRRSSSSRGFGACDAFLHRCAPRGSSTKRVVERGSILVTEARALAEEGMGALPSQDPYPHQHYRTPLHAGDRKLALPSPLAAPPTLSEMTKARYKASRHRCTWRTRTRFSPLRVRAAVYRTCGVSRSTRLLVPTDCWCC